MIVGAAAAAAACGVAGNVMTFLPPTFVGSEPMNGTQLLLTTMHGINVVRDASLKKIIAFVVATTLQSGSARNVVRDSLAIAESLVDAGTLLSKRPTSFLRSRTNVGSH